MTSLKWTGRNEGPRLLRGTDRSKPACGTPRARELPTRPQMWMVRPQTCQTCQIWPQNILSARSVSETDLQLGEVKFSYGYGGTAKVDSEELSVEKGFLRVFPFPGFGE